MEAMFCSVVDSFVKLISRRLSDIRDLVQHKNRKKQTLIISETFNVYTRKCWSASLFSLPAWRPWRLRSVGNSINTPLTWTRINIGRWTASKCSQLERQRASLLITARSPCRSSRRWILSAVWRTQQVRLVCILEISVSQSQQTNEFSSRS